MKDAKPRNGAATRDAILAAARRRFATESYEAVGMRDVAREAGIDVALVSRYFGSKEDLFRKVLLERTGEKWFGGHTDPAGIVSWLVDLATGSERDRDDIERLSIILRSASSVATANIVRNAFVDDVFAPLVSLLGGVDPEGRASLALSLVIGVTVLRGIANPRSANRDQRETERDELRHLLLQALYRSGGPQPEASACPPPDDVRHSTAGAVCFQKAASLTINRPSVQALTVPRFLIQAEVEYAAFIRRP